VACQFIVGLGNVQSALEDRNGVVSSVAGMRMTGIRCARQPFGAISLSIALAGCAHTQLNSNTLDVAGTIESLYREQALTNLSRLIDDPNNIPSQVDISSGSVQTQDSITPSLNLPLGNQIVRNGSTLVIQTIQENVRALMLGVSGSWTQSWSITPVTDTNALSRLRAVYRYAINDYYQENGGLNRRCNDDNDSVNDEKLKQECAEQQLKNTYNLNIIATNNGMVVDASRVIEPQCVICLDREQILKTQEQKNNDEKIILTKYNRSTRMPIMMLSHRI
jgi:hypothetical protein